jgi:low temperature requirement protein LtrA
MIGRSPDEPHRAATTLELLFDLVFVVAIAQVAAGLHHAIAEAHVGDGLLKYGLVFCAIWWAWMGFTWFATSFDTDDVPYRLTVLVQLAGALILAAGVSPAFKEMDFSFVAGGYVVMRVAMVTQWVRAGRAVAENRPGCFRMATGIAIVQVFWVVLMFLHESWFLPGFLLLIAVELAIPYWAWQKLGDLWNRHHVAERYGLLTIIVLGESILAASLALQAAVDAHDLSGRLFVIMLGGLMIVFALWWLYFDTDGAGQLTSMNRAFIWGYGHYFVFASGAAVGAGIAVGVDHATQQAAIGSFGAGMAVAAPVAVFLISVWLLHARDNSSIREKAVGLVAIVLVLLTPFTGHAVMLTGILTMMLVGFKTIL